MGPQRHSSRNERTFGSVVPSTWSNLLSGSRRRTCARVCFDSGCCVDLRIPVDRDRGLYCRFMSQRTCGKAHGTTKGEHYTDWNRPDHYSQSVPFHTPESTKSETTERGMDLWEKRLLDPSRLDAYANYDAEFSHTPWVLQTVETLPPETSLSVPDHDTNPIAAIANDKTNAPLERQQQHHAMAYPDVDYLTLRSRQNLSWSSRQLEQGIQAAQKEDYTTARHHYQQGLDLVPRHADLLVAYGSLEANQGKWDRAQQLLQQALEVDATHVNARRYLEEIRQAVALRQRRSGLADKSAVALRDASLEQQMMQTATTIQSSTVATAATATEDNPYPLLPETREEKDDRRKMKRHKKSKHRKTRRRRRRRSEKDNSVVDDVSLSLSDSTSSSARRKKRRQRHKERRRKEKQTVHSSTDDEQSLSTADRDRRSRKRRRKDRDDESTSQRHHSRQNKRRDHQEYSERRRRKRREVSSNDSVDSGATVDSLKLLRKKRDREHNRATHDNGQKAIE
jgi:tetratricopeptide (TPR) repeat protein